MYYNRFDPNKNYKKIRFLDSRFIQSAEQNEMQEYIRYDIKALAGSIFEDGGILEGGGISLVGSIAKVEQSTIYYGGYSVNIPPKEIEISLIDTVVIGSAIRESVVTFKDDIGLLNPAVGTAGFHDEGAERVKVSGRWCMQSEVAEDEVFYPTFTFIDGILQSVKKIAPELDGARKIVARYDYDSNGSYVVDGLVVSFDRDDIQDKEHILSISKGNAHVNGNELIFEYDQKTRVSFALDTHEVIAEPQTFVGDGRYSLRHTPIASISRVIGVVESVESVTHGGYAGVKDILSNSPVISITQISQGETVFVAGRDFVQNGDFVDWSLGGDEPSSGSTYEVQYKYQESFENIEHDSSGFDLSGLSVGSQFSVNYKYYLKRKDVVVLTKDGSFKILRGKSDEFAPKAPKNSIGLALATVEVAFGETPKIELEYNRITNNAEILQMREQIDILSYNIAKLSLDYNARKIDPTLDKKEIFIDPFVDEDLRDLGIEQSAIIFDGMLFPNINFVEHSFNMGRELFLDRVSTTNIVEQKARTGARKINEYIEAPVPTNSIEISPATYRWIADSRLVWTWGWSSTRTSVSSHSYIIPRTNIAIYAKTFADEIVEVLIDDISVGEFQSTATEVEGQFELNTTVSTPLGLRSGNKLLKVVGKSSGIVVETVWVAVPLVQTRFVRIRWRDPLAQTVLFDRDFFSKEIELYIEKLPLSDLTLTIVKTTTGIPDMKQSIYSEVFAKESLALGWYKFEFAKPILFEADVEYALVVESGDSVGEIGIARLGFRDLDGDNWIHTQPYNGVLLSSSNSSSWSIYQKEDLSFVVKKEQFELQKEIEIGTLRVEKCTDLFLMAGVENYVGTGANFTAMLVDRDNEKVAISPYSLSSIKEYSGEIKVDVILSSDNDEFTPIVDRDIVLGIGVVNSNSTYVSRLFGISGDRIDIYLDIKEIGESVKVYIQIADEFVEVDRNSSKNRLLGDGWVETCFTAQNLTIDSTRIKIELISQDVNRPEVKNLRGIVS